MKRVFAMQPLDLQVIQRAIHWLESGRTVWLCTVIASFGSSPRPPGAMLVAKGDGASCGSLSGGCIEEDFLQRVAQGGFAEPIALVRYGDGSDAPRVRLPCGGVLEVLVERLEAPGANVEHLRRLESALLGRGRLVREWRLPFANPELLEDSQDGPRVERSGDRLRVRFGAAQRLVIAGVSTVALFCAQFAVALDFEVIICEPREEFQHPLGIANVRVEPVLPARWIAEGGCHEATAVVALTHDPRLDDLTMMEAVNSPAFYIGVMGSQKTSEKRMERLQRIAGMDDATLARIHAPIGLALGSKTPAEIALAVLADIVRVRNGVARERV